MYDFPWLYIGFGGQIDFIRGAAVSLDGEGKPIIACTSTIHKHDAQGKPMEESRIVTNLKPGENLPERGNEIYFGLIKQAIFLQIISTCKMLCDFRST